ncbi:DUF3558 domain-containing protein [Rhodococcus sp. USK13]|uniref:DUF3558 domain-containing protein n=1 Tax=Rhodococcus sp. USK13 TaxID=2806442 RepID=UPI001BCDE059|nr:DUF3558 domain-containing protein [Rhodococcus sp. USK13]
MNRPIRWIGTISTVIALTGCGTPAGQEDSTADAASASTTTRAPRHIDKSDRPQVTFDPCLDIPDSALIEAGYDPRSERNADFTPDEYTFLGCSYKTPQRLYGMNVLSGNITFAEEQAKTKNLATPIEINGRRALLKFDPGIADACDLSIETADGFMGITRTLFKGTGMPAPESEWCAGLEDTARIFERYIPKEG